MRKFTLILALVCVATVGLIALILDHWATLTIHAQSTGCTDSALALAEGQITDALDYTSAVQFPVETNPTNSNKWDLSNSAHWTSGFFPGVLWFLYEKDLTSSWLTRAQQQTSIMQAQDVNAVDHDIGFKILASYGNAWGITRDPSAMSVIQTAANAMATNLWRPGAGVIESWPNYDSHITVIVDNMMNLELLLFAAQHGGNSAWRDMAVSHALKTMQNHVRADGSTYHVVDYNTDGTVFSKFTVQGAGNESTWARGQAWGIYGFTMVYRYTQDSRFLTTAQSLANYFINNLPSDFVPYWDFSQFGAAPRDSSAAAIGAAGLLELSTYVSAADSTRYRNAALSIQSSLSSPAYLGDRLATDGILLHGSANVPGSDADKSLIYGDYYFLQSCFRATPPPRAPLSLTATRTSGTQVDLAWDAPSAAALRYNVKRSVTPGGPYISIAPPPVLTGTNFSDSGVAAGSDYYYVVSATGVGGEGPDSLEASTVITNPTPTISSLSPASVTAGRDFTLTVNGSNFLASSVVNFAGKAEPTNFVSTIQLTAAIPAADVSSGGTIPIMVTNTVSGTISPAAQIAIDDFALSAPASATLSSGKSISIPITIAPASADSFDSAVNFTLSGLPSGATANFTPNTLTPGAAAATTTLTITAAATAGAISQCPIPNLPQYWTPITPTAFAILIFAGICVIQHRRAGLARSGGFPRATLVVLLSIVSGCGGGGGSVTPSVGAQPRTSRVTVSATAGTDVKTATFTLIIQ